MSIDDMVARARYDIGCLVPDGEARREFDREFTQYSENLIRAVKDDKSWRRAKHATKRFLREKGTP